MSKKILMLTSAFLVDENNAVRAKNEHGYKKMHGLPPMAYITRVDGFEYDKEGYVNDIAVGLTLDGRLYDPQNGDLISFEHKIISIIPGHTRTLYVHLSNKNLHIFDCVNKKLGELVSENVEYVESTLNSECYEIRVEPSAHVSGIFFILIDGSCHVHTDDGLYKAYRRGGRTKLKLDLDDVRMVKSSLIIMMNGDIYRHQYDELFKKIKGTTSKTQIMDAIEACQNIFTLDSEGNIYFNNEKIIPSRFLSDLKVEKFVHFDLHKQRSDVHFIDNKGDLFRLTKTFCIKDIPLQFSINIGTNRQRSMIKKATH